MTASILQQLLALYFAIRYSWQLSSSEKSLVGKKNSSVCLKDFTDLDFFFTFCLSCFFSFSLKNACLLSRLRRIYAVLWVADRFVGWETPQNNVFDLIQEMFENLNSISNIFQKTHDFVVFTNSVINFTYL